MLCAVFVACVMCGFLVCVMCGLLVCVTCGFCTFLACVTCGLLPSVMCVFWHVLCEMFSMCYVCFVYHALRLVLSA